MSRDQDKLERMMRAFYAHQDKLRAYTFAAVRDFHATEEILQDVAIVVAQKAEEFDESGTIEFWVLGIARNKILKWHKRRGREARNIAFDVISECLPHARSFESDYVAERRQALQNCLSHLPDRQKKIVELRYVDDQDCPYIAEVLGRSIQSIYSLLKRIKTELRNCVEQQLRSQEAL